ncbi:PleD family two-component system response regulator [Pedobacter sp. SYSU D00535]|uniref:response regulator n=1 Tax=Pedobacter sp. SYSU D00535 TaxID=2810308 RepID=UPI001A978C16|nr:response regulator [Pedobacter sp. SYSU D00535]
MKKILVLDDDETILEALEDALTCLNYEVKTVKEVKSLFPLLEAYKPHLLLLDFMLSNSNGGAICHQIKTAPTFHNLPVIMMSGYNDVNELSQKSGCNEFIKKPFDLMELDKKIRACLESNENAELMNGA